MQANHIRSIYNLLKNNAAQAIGVVWAILITSSILYNNHEFYHDDAYITLRYVKNYIDGSGIVWNTGEYVQGYTNFLHLMLISILARFNIDLVIASRIVGIFTFFATIFTMILLHSTFESKHSKIMSYLPAILVATSAPMIVWSLGGLEGTLFSFLVTISCFLLIYAVNHPNNYWFYFLSGLLFGLIFLTRPDGIIFFVVSFFWLFWMVFKNKTHNNYHLIIFTLGLAILVIPYISWQISYYGDIVPNTFYAKSGTPLGLRLLSGWSYIVRYSMQPPFIPIIVIISAAYSISKRSWNSTLSYLAILISSYIFFVFQVGGDHMTSFRLMLPIIPLISALSAMILSSIKNTSNITIKCIILIIMASIYLQIQDPFLNPLKEDPASFVGTIIGKYIAQSWPEGSVIALNTAGSTPYYANENQYIDMLGLNDPIIAKRTITNLELPAQSLPGHLKGDGAYVLSRNPDFIIIGPAEGTLASQAWFLSDLELSRDPRFARDYTLVRVSLDSDGHPVSKGQITFTYYMKIKAQKEVYNFQPAGLSNKSPHSPQWITNLENYLVDTR